MGETWWMLRARGVLGLLLLLPVARAWTLELLGADDLTFADGAEFRGDGPLARSGGKGPIIRSGGPQQHSSVSTVKPSPEPIKRVQLDYDYLIGYEGPGPPPVLSVWVTDGPEPTGGNPGAKLIYTSPPLPFDPKEKKHSYDTCDDKDQSECYKPGTNVNAACEECTGKFVQIRFANNANNVQLLLPITISINEETEPVSYVVYFAVVRDSTITTILVGRQACRTTRH